MDLLLRPTFGGVVASITTLAFTLGGFTVALGVLAAGLLVGSLLFMYRKINQLDDTTQSLVTAVNDQGEVLQKMREEGNSG